MVARRHEKLALAGDESLSAGYGHAAEAERELAVSLRREAIGWGAGAVVAGVIAIVVQGVVIAHDGQTVALALLGPKLAVVLALGALPGT